jgi:hypothetical protein
MIGSGVLFHFLVMFFLFLVGARWHCHCSIPVYSDIVFGAMLSIMDIWDNNYSIWSSMRQFQTAHFILLIKERSL